MVPDVEDDILNKELPAVLAAGSEDELGIDGRAKREDEVDKRVGVEDTREVGKVTIAAKGKVWVLDEVKKVEDGVITVLGVAVSEVMLVVCMVLSEEGGLAGEVMLEAGGNVGVLDAVVMLAGVAMIVDGVVMVRVGLTSEVVGFI